MYRLSGRVRQIKYQHKHLYSILIVIPKSYGGSADLSLFRFRVQVTIGVLQFLYLPSHYITMT